MPFIPSTPYLPQASGFVNDLTNSLGLSAGKKLDITPSVTGNEQQLTVMCNIRRTDLGTAQYILSGGTFCAWYFASDDTLRWSGAAGVGAFTTTRKFRDTEWMSLGIAVDTVAQTIKMVLNDEEITDWATQTAPTASIAVGLNLAGTPMAIGAYNNGTGSLEACVSDFVLLDGTVLTPEEMIAYRTRTIPFGGSLNTTTKKFVIESPDTYGENGCQLLFEDGGDLGESTAGNLTSWGVTDLTSSDQLLDTPGNPYPILSVLDGLGYLTISAGGTDWARSSATWRSGRASQPIPRGKYYFEAVFADISYSAIGLATPNSPLDGNVGQYDSSWGIYAKTSIEWIKYHNNVGVDGFITPAPVSGDIVQVCVDSEAGKVWFGVNNNFEGDPAAGTGESYSGLPEIVVPMVSAYSQTANRINFGQRPLEYTPPENFRELKNSNFPTPEFNGRDKFAVAVSEGTGAARNIPTPFEKTGLFWGKSRSNSYSHRLEDRVRGAGKGLFSNTTAAEESRVDSVTEFGDSFVSLGVDVGAGFNANGVDYVYWMFGNDGTEVTNTEGSVDSQVIVDSSGYMSIAQATTLVAGDTFGVGILDYELSIIKDVAQAGAQWPVWCQYVSDRDGTSQRYLSLDSSNGQSAMGDTLRSMAGGLITSGSGSWTIGNVISYNFKSIPGLSKIGYYKGTGTNSGTFTYLGFKPRWFMVKRFNSAANWFIFDSVLNTWNVMTGYLSPNLSSSELADSSLYVDFYASGFKPRGASVGHNGNGDSYIYLAIAEAAGGGLLPPPLGR